MDCPDCGFPISEDNIYAEKDIFECHSCSKIFSISKQAADDLSFDINEPPKGISIEKSNGNLIITATAQSGLGCVFMPLALIVSFLIFSGLAQMFSSFPDPGLADCLFLIPFVIIIAVVWFFALMTVIGKIKLAINNEGGRIFTGIGRFGITKKFLWKDIDGIRKYWIRWRNGSRIGLKLTGKKTINFGDALNNERKNYLYNAIALTSAQRKSGKKII